MFIVREWTGVVDGLKHKLNSALTLQGSWACRLLRLLLLWFIYLSRWRQQVCNLLFGYLLNWVFIEMWSMSDGSVVFSSVSSSCGRKSASGSLLFVSQSSNSLYTMAPLFFEGNRERSPSSLCWKVTCVWTSASSAHWNITVFLIRHRQEMIAHMRWNTWAVTTTVKMPGREIGTNTFLLFFPKNINI